MYKIVNLVQGSPEWHSWKRFKIGASSIAAVMGLNPWESPLKLWTRMIEGKEICVTDKMRRGTELEPVARKMVNEKCGRNYAPVCMESKEHPFMIASLDGWSEVSHPKILEIKCGSHDLHQKAIMGEVPIYYFAQLQYQMMLTDEEEALYASFDEKSLAEVVIKRDDLFIEKAKSSATAFFDSLVNCEPPEPLDMDLNTIDDPKALEWAKSLNEIEVCLKDLEKQKEVVRKELIKFADGKNSKCGDLKIVQTTRKGAIDYKNVPEIKAMDLEAYRKPTSKYWRFSQ